MRTKVFKSGNSMALRIPRKFGAKEGEVTIERVGNRWLVEPHIPEEWPKDFFRKIRITDPDFNRPEQGDHRDFSG
ncbi:AbrB/MazE/SpoVT family DNA-binding domain-containing protein [Puniceicoccales bacterium CK1056]|uniref:AbrB/MazE/SpoVT family DNA-binding domain-containing protein n=1 Tax=Oceanipulchritudo coccoides TaxID=2706888 RepID=A0A6B2LZF4_9BACT|nr:AbrB/MazE/SpoVT family DNA-binding domain-containing protein [Oceanipulchritudo coccoides]NDV61446.1 AbrB/MazE/SpoVT family DNA-binding domain-containing protein [Oceanipulchritudo coccoides]